MFIDDEDTIVVEFCAAVLLTARVAGDDNVLGKANVRYIQGNTVGVDS
jgi:cytochrome c oxidase subunit 2